MGHMRAVAAVVLMLAGCAADADEADEHVRARIDLVSYDGGIATNRDDTRCVWHEVQVVIRDGDGNVIAANDAPEMAGRVVDTRPDYECRTRLLHLGRLPVADFYDIAVEAESISLTGDSGAAAGSVTLPRADVEGGTVEVEVSRGR